MLKKKIAIWGNDIIADILSLIAPNEWSIYKICSSPNTRMPYPYYANDINDGVLKYFAIQSGLFDIVDFKKSARSIVILTDNGNYIFPCSFEGFWRRLIYYFPNEKDGLCLLSNNIRIIGTEWRNWIANGFATRMGEMKYSAKYSKYTVSDINLLFNIHNSEIREILWALVPKKDIAISVLSGYLFTQCFDINAFKDDLFRWIHEQSQERITTLQNETESVHEADIIIDSANRLSSGFSLHLNSGYGMFKIDGYDKTLQNIVFYSYNSKFWIRIWNRRTLNQKANDEWWFEYIAFSKEIDIYRFIRKNIKSIFQRDVILSNCYNSESLVNSFSNTIAGGFSWAFSPSESMHDPLHLIIKKCPNRLSYGQWGYAWFVAAFDLYRQLQKE